MACIYVCIINLPWTEINFQTRLQLIIFLSVKACLISMTGIQNESNFSSLERRWIITLSLGVDASAVNDKQSNVCPLKHDYSHRIGTKKSYYHGALRFYILHAYDKNSKHVCKNVWIFYSPFRGSGGFCTTIKMKSSSGATRISCFRLLMRKYVNSLAGSKSRTIDLARSESCEINTEYYLYKKKKRILYKKKHNGRLMIIITQCQRKCSGE